ncbi:MAG: alpha/beta fold hydrolase, partial [Kaistella sp.]
ILNIDYLHMIIGGSLGGSIGWEMLAIQPRLAEYFIPIACDYKTSDWLHAQCLVQKFLLNQREDPLKKARIHAMLCYRTPKSLNERFNNDFDDATATRKSQDWLNYHAESLNERFSLSAYRLMSHLLMNINADLDRLKNISAEIHLIAVDSDLFFPAFEIKKCYEDLIRTKKNTFYYEINSIHGHDAFLMEYEQLNKILGPIINKKNDK